MNELKALGATALSWLLFTTFTLTNWIWFFKIDFDPVWETDGIFMLVGITLITFLHLAFNVLLTAVVFWFDGIWSEEIFNAYEEYFEGENLRKVRAPKDTVNICDADYYFISTSKILRDL